MTDKPDKKKKKVKKNKVNKPFWRVQDGKPLIKFKNRKAELPKSLDRDRLCDVLIAINKYILCYNIVGT